MARHPRNPEGIAARVPGYTLKERSCMQAAPLRSPLQRRAAAPRQKDTCFADA